MVRSGGPAMTDRRDSVLRAFLDAFLFGLRPFDRAAWRQALISEDAQGLDFRTLAITRAVLQDLDVARTGHAVFGDLLFFLGQRPPQHKQLANVLDRCGIEFIGQGLEYCFPSCTVIGLNTYLDQPVRIERSVRFFFDSRCQTVRTYHHDSIQVVCLGALVFALGGSELYLSHDLIIGGVRHQVNLMPLRSEDNQCI